jgi:hypothetical protein
LGENGTCSGNGNIEIRITALGKSVVLKNQVRKKEKFSGMAIQSLEMPVYHHCANGATPAFNTVHKCSTDNPRHIWARLLIFVWNLQHKKIIDEMLSIGLETLSGRSATEVYSMAVLILFAILFLIYEGVRWSARIPDFVGPPGVPVYGNLLQSHNKDAPKQYRDWSYKYGSVYQIQLGNIPILVINTAAAAKKILTQNSHATASRPEFYTFHKVCSVSPWFNVRRLFEKVYETNYVAGHL